MDVLFRLSSTRRRDPAVEAWLQRATRPLASVAREWFLRMRGCGDDVRELLHDGRPTACVKDAAFGYVDVFTTHVNVGFFFGADLDDPAGLLEGRGRRMRHVEVRADAAPDREALGDLTDLAYADIKWRLGAT